MKAFACEKDDNYCFYDWMYAAFWFSNDTVYNKCYNLIATYSTAQDNFSGEFTKEKVNAMLKKFWTVWTNVSCRLG